jgi:DNA-directed RNA polymerase subunit RPC12/RpoP
MATSAGKTIGLILLVLAFIWLAVNITPFIFAPFGVFSGAIESFRFPNFKTVHIGPSMFRIPSLTSFFSFALLIIWIMVIVWVYRDAERRGMNGILWALLVFIGNIIGLIIYLILRSDAAFAPKAEPAAHTCPKCQKSVSSTYVFCPYCAAKLHTICSECGKPTEKNWKACPHCGKNLKE